MGVLEKLNDKYINIIHAQMLFVFFHYLEGYGKDQMRACLSIVLVHFLVKESFEIFIKL